MGLLDRIFNRRKTSDAPHGLRSAGKKASRLTPDQLSELSDQELMIALQARIESDAGSNDPAEQAATLEGPAKDFFILSRFHREIFQGGLCQFFVHSSRSLAPMVSDALKRIGAEDYAALYDHFIQRHRIDPSDLDSFIIDNLGEYEGQAARYPFDDFDGAYYRLSQDQSLPDHLLQFARSHITQM